MLLRNRVALVSTGGPLGRTLVEVCADEGADVVWVQRTGDDERLREAEDIGRDVEAACGVRVHLLSVDLTGLAADLPGQAVALTARVRQIVERVDLLVTGPGDPPLGRPGDLMLADWRAGFAQGGEAAIALILACLPLLPPGGSVVTLTSVAQAAPFPGQPVPAAVSAALTSFTRSAAGDYADRGLRFNAVAMGLLDDGTVDSVWPSGRRAWSRTSPAGRPVTPQEVAWTVAFLASERAQGINGTTITVDGGWSAGARLT